MSLQDGKTNVHYLSPIVATENDALVDKINFGYEELSSVLRYDPKKGLFNWIVSTGARIRGGAVAGTWLMQSNNKKYLSITYKGRKIMASHVAWMLSYKEWPDRTVFYIDDNTENLCLSNLKLADYKAIRETNDEGVTRYIMRKEQARHYGLARWYNITMAQYADMFAAQNGCCAICNKPETAKIPGRKSEHAKTGIRDLSVDHDHATGAVRQLLCNACNHMLGHALDNADVLRAAADYIEFHRKALKNAS